MDINIKFCVENAGNDRMLRNWVFWTGLNFERKGEEEDRGNDKTDKTDNDVTVKKVYKSHVIIQPLTAA